MIDLSRHIRPGDGVWWSQGSAEPTVLVHALLLDQADRFAPVRAFCGLSWDERLTTSLPESVTVMSYGALDALRRLSARGRLTVVPCSYSALPQLFADGSLPRDVGLVQVSPPDADGLCSLGVGSITRPTPAERMIGRRVAGLIEDGDTIQLGVGSLPSGLLQALTGHAELGVHSGMISDAVLALVDKGILTGRRKEIDPGVIVTGAAVGSQQLYPRIPHLPVAFRRPATPTHPVCSPS